MKRYVMLEDKTIIDRNDTDTIYQRASEILFTKQSDNLLDLLEVGDCVEDRRIGIEEVDDAKLEINYYTIRPDNLIAIWKRNHNTMTRYPIDKELR